MKKKIAIAFTGFPAYHDPRKQAYYRFLADRYELTESATPEYVIDGGQNFRHMKYDALKILIDSENVIPDFNLYDYAVGSSELTLGDRYLRVPWFAFYPAFAELGTRRLRSEEELLNREFCSFVVSNAEFGDPLRRVFFERLSKYKKVASGGAWRNNVGGTVPDKIAFCRGYKFNIAFENSAYPGYVTEKVMEALAAQSVPIYYGNPTIETDFNRASLVVVKDAADVEHAVEEIVALDRDDAAYLSRVKAPCLVEPPETYEKRLEDFLASIFDRPLDEARRVAAYGHQAMLRQHLKYVYGVDQFVRDFPGYTAATRLLGKVRALKRGL